MIAVSAAIVESQLRNVAYGDRDSLGLFQQRPSQDWGLPRDILNPALAAGKFYDALRRAPALGRAAAGRRGAGRAALGLPAALRPAGAAAARSGRPFLGRAGRSGWHRQVRQPTASGRRWPPWPARTRGAPSCRPGPDLRWTRRGCPPATRCRWTRCSAPWSPPPWRQLGKPYAWGAKGPDAFDCSGLTQAAWATAGVPISAGTIHQIRDGDPVPDLAQLAPGDLLFIPGSYGTAAVPRHVGLYIGGGLVVDARNTRRGVILSSLDDWRDRIVAVRHIGGPSTAGPA